MEEVFEKLCNVISKQRILKEEPMSKHTTFKIGGKADLFVKVSTLNELQDVLKIAKEYDLPITIIGNGSNILVKDNGIRGIVIQIDMQNYSIDVETGIATVAAGVKLAFLAQKLLLQELAGFEFASGIPGTIGGAIRMNAGAYGKEMKDVVISTKYLDIETGEIVELTNEEQLFEYRKSIFSIHKKYIILETKLQLEKGKNEEIKEKMNEYARKKEK